MFRDYDVDVARSPRLRAGILTALLVTAAPLTAVGPAARAQTTADCVVTGGNDLDRYGPTDISATSGNQELSAAVNADGTVTLLKWPSPSYYDQIKYRTTDRDEPRMGALPNEGALIGIAWKPFKKGWGFAWLRQWHSSQRFVNDANDTIVTRFKNKKHGLKVTVRDVVAATTTALLREVKVTRSRRSPIRKIRIMSFANLNPVVSKIRQAPISDWCTEERNDDGAEYLEDEHLVVHTLEGIDESTSASRSVAVGMGFTEPADGVEVGEDTYEAGRAGVSAYDDAGDGKLSGSTSATAQADAALFVERSLRKRRARPATIVMAAAGDLEGLAAAATDASSRSFSSFVKVKARWWSSWLRGARIPKGAPPPVVRLAKRALISLRQGIDPNSSLVVTSLATQAPLGLDWVRQGAYINEALRRAGHTDAVEAHNRRYALLQATSVSKPPGGEATPAGNWSQAFYGDGVVGGPVPYEIDSTGLGIWTLADLHDKGAEPGYLSAVYAAIQRAAHYLTDDPPLGCRDPATGLHCSAHEDGDPNPQRTLAGAQAAWLGLGAAADAATARGTEGSLANALRWSERQDELGDAIVDAYFDEDCACFTEDHLVGGTLLWPVRFVAPRSTRGKAQADVNFIPIRKAMRGKVSGGELESRALLGNAYAWAGDTKKTKRLKAALRWIADELTTPGTGLLGQGWQVTSPEEGSETIVMGSQPHNWNQAMFYLAALKVYGSKVWNPTP